MLKAKSRNPDIQSCYRAIPSVQELLQSGDLQAYGIAQPYLKQLIQAEIELFREQIPREKKLSPAAIPGQLRKHIARRLERLTRRSLKRVINATGIILHTNMGRAPLAGAALQAIAETAEHYNNLEIDLTTGKRGQRNSHVEELLCLITGAEAAMIVNNCAAAIFLVLNSLCRRKEVPVSRGELVEIGGSFRMPDVMKAGGAKMVEIGTTNKTHLRDYENALSPRTGALLKVHTSNFRILGFTREAGLAELVELAHRQGLPLLYDMGSGVIEDLRQWGYPPEPVTREVLAEGVDVVTFSGDKILGGPQAGIIAGKKVYLDKIRKNHLARALRCDKLIYAAMEATLRLYLQPENLPEHLPVAVMLNCPVETLRRRAETVAATAAGSGLNIAVVETFSQMGSGALPLEQIPSIALKITAGGISPVRLSQRLRANDPPIAGYVQEDALFLNLRTIREDELPLLEATLRNLAGER